MPPDISHKTKVYLQQLVQNDLTHSTSSELAFPPLSLLRPRHPSHTRSYCPRLGSLEAECCVCVAVHILTVPDRPMSDCHLHPLRTRPRLATRTYRRSMYVFVRPGFGPDPHSITVY